MTFTLTKPAPVTSIPATCLHHRRVVLLSTGEVLWGPSLYKPGQTESQLAEWCRGQVLKRGGAMALEWKNRRGEWVAYLVFNVRRATP